MPVKRLAVDVATGVQLVDGVILQSALFVVLVAAYQMDLLNSGFQTYFIAVPGERSAVEVNGLEDTAFLVAQVSASELHSDLPNSLITDQFLNNIFLFNSNDQVNIYRRSVLKYTVGPLKKIYLAVNFIADVLLEMVTR